MSLDALYELSRRSIVVNKGEETLLSWHNSTLAVRTEKGLHFMDYSHNLECLDKKIDFIETYTPNPTTSPAYNLLAAKFVKTGMSNMEYTEMILNPALWAHNTQMVQNFVTISVFEWSPVDLLQHKRCALAVLNNIGNVELYGRIRDKWTNIFSLCSHVRKIYKDQMTVPEDVYTLKQTAYNVHTCAICWAPSIFNNNSCYLVTAQKNGDILFWLLNNNGANINAKLQGVVKSETFEISTMLWIPIMEDKFLLVCSNLLGQILGYDCVIEKEEIKQINSHTLWHHKDRMIAKCLQYTIIDNNIVLICIKHRHLFAQMFDKKIKILSQNVNNVNDHKITCITMTEGGFYLTTINFKIYKVNIKVLGVELIVSLELIEIREPFIDYEVYSIGFSPNNLMSAIGMTERKVLCRKEPITVNVVLTTTERKMEMAISILLNNPTKKLTDYWDCIELLRYKIIKTSMMPLIDYSELYTEGQNDGYKLKIYLIFLIMYDKLKNTARIGADVIFPESSAENIREKIFFNHAINVINKLNENKTKENFSYFEIESFHGAKKYIEFYCQKRSKNVSDFVSINSSYINSTPTYICQCCDNKLNGFSCEDGHLNMFCFLSFTLIESADEYLVCKNCGLTGRTELFPDKPTCLICDLYLCVT